MASSRPSSAVSVVRLTSAQTIPLRHAVLWPEKPPAFVVLPEDDLATTTHLGAVPIAAGPSSPSAGTPISQEPISIITLVPAAFPSPGLSHRTALRFRKFATAHAHQGQGVGAQLLAAVFALADGEAGAAELVWCDARAEQQGWYERRGMRREGGVFDKDGRAYVRMVREAPAQGSRT